MSDFQPVRRKGHNSNQPNTKFPTQFQTLSEMGFDAKRISSALDSTKGNLEAATALLLGEPVPNTNSSSNSQSTSTSADNGNSHNHSVSSTGSASKSSTSNKSNTNSTKNNTKNGNTNSTTTSSTSISNSNSTNNATVSNGNSAKNSKLSVREVHDRFMATYKVHKCKEKGSHDKRTCIYWHSRGDRRRNPFEQYYSCSECPNSIDNANSNKEKDSNKDNYCENGDSCLKAHNMLERMFHPDLFKISMCQRGPNSSQCERGNLCAFAHNEEDHRTPFQWSLERAAAGIKDPIVNNRDIKDLKDLNGNSINTAIVNGASTSSGKSAVGKGSSANSTANDNDTEKELPLQMRTRLLDLIKSQGADGIIGSELPKKYYDAYNERLEFFDDDGEKFRMKEYLSKLANISVVMHKGVQPKYVYLERSAVTSASVASTTLAGKAPGAISYSAATAVGSAGAAAATNSNSTAQKAQPISNSVASTTSEPTSAQQVKQGQEANDKVAAADTVERKGTPPPSDKPLNYSKVLVGATPNSTRRRGPDTAAASSDEKNSSGSPSKTATPTNLSDNQSTPGPEVVEKTPLAITADTTEKLLEVNTVNSNLRMQIATLQSELANKAQESDSKSSQLAAAMMKVAELEATKISNISDTSSSTGEINRLRSEVENLKDIVRKYQDDEARKREDIRVRETMMNQIQQDKVKELTLCSISLGNIESFLMDMQQKEAMNISDGNLSEALQVTQQSRGELIKFVVMLKNQLMNKANAANINPAANLVASPSISLSKSVNLDLGSGFLSKSQLNSFGHNSMGSIFGPDSTATTLSGGFLGLDVGDSSLHDDLLMATDTGLGNGLVASLGGSLGGSLTGSIFGDDMTNSNHSIFGRSARNPGAKCALPGCTEPGSFICSACGKAGYCGVEHQR